MSNKSCRNQSFRPWGIYTDERRRIDEAGHTGTANPDSYQSLPVPVYTNHAPSIPAPRPFPVSVPPALPASGYAQHEQQYQQQGQYQEPSGGVAIISDFERQVAEYQQQQATEPKRELSTYHKGMTKEALLIMQQQSRQSYMHWSPRRFYEDIVDRLEAAYLVLVERHKEFLVFLHQNQQQQAQLYGQTMSSGIQQGLVSVQAVDQQLKGIESFIERANALRWQSVNEQTVTAQNQFDAALQRGVADDGIVVAMEHGAETIESNGRSIEIVGQHWARDKFKSALAELGAKDPQEYAAFWRSVRQVRLEIPKDWSGRYDGETLPNGVLRCNPYISRQRMLGNTVHNLAHVEDRYSSTLAESERYAEQRETAFWQKQGKQNMAVFA